MTAQPYETGPVRVPRTVDDIRAALSPEQHAAFDTDLADADRFAVRGVLDKWWARAMLASEADQVEAMFAAARRGELATIPAVDVVPGWRAR